jgi:molecular chaperone DnaJ
MVVTTAKRDYYEVLGLARDADARAIKDAFRTLAMKYHPDRNKDPGAEDRFKEIAEAYAVLSDPKKRGDYDAGGFAGVAGFSPEDLFGGIDFDSIFADFGFGLGGGMFDRLFRHRRAGPSRGADLQIDAVVPLEKIAAGGEETIRFSRTGTCAECSGSGAKAGTQPRACATCGGTGLKTTSHRDKGVFISQSTTCPDCRGRGRFIDAPCPACAGTGRLGREEALVVRIPAGADEGLVLRIPAKGYPSEQAGGAAGDLLVIVRTAPDERFQRDGADLWRDETIDITDAVLGTELSVPTLAGRATVKLPAGTQPDARLRLRGKGLPRFGGRGRGDLYVRVAVRVPETLGSEERKLWERLRALRGHGT